METCVALVLAALAQGEGEAIAALSPPSPAARAAEDWRAFFVYREPELPLFEEDDADDVLIPLDLRVTELGLARLREMREAPVVFPTISRIVFGIPAFLIEGLTALTMPDPVTIGNQRVFDRGTGDEDLAWLFGRTLVRREISFLGGLGGTYLATTEVELGLESPDRHRFDRLQQRVFYDSFKRAYRERYAIPALDVDVALNAIQSGSWLDYLIVPGLVSAYTAKFGLERKFHLTEDIRVQVSIEKGTRFYKVATQDHGGRLASVALNFFDLPVSAIVSVDSLESGIGLGFIGIGTDLHAVIEACNGAKGSSGEDAGR